MKYRCSKCKESLIADERYYYLYETYCFECYVSKRLDVSKPANDEKPYENKRSKKKSHVVYADTNKRNIIDELKRWREDNALSTREAGDIIGISKTGYRDIENGVCVPRKRTLAKIAVALDLPVSEFDWKPR